MPITPAGVIGAGSSSGSDHVAITLTAGVPASTPTLAQHVAILLSASGPSHEAIVGITDTAVVNPLYGTCYGTGNQYRRLGIEQGGSSFDQDLQGGLILHALKIGDVITVQYAGAWSDIHALAIAFSGALAAPAPFVGGGFACVLPVDLGGGPTANTAVTYLQHHPPTGAGTTQHSSGNIVIPGADWDWSAALAYVLYQVGAFQAGGGQSWSFDDAGVTNRGGWLGVGPNTLAAQLGEQLLAGPKGPHVGADIPLGGTWGANVQDVLFLGAAVGIAAGAGPPYCSAPPGPTPGRRKCCGSRCLCTTLTLPSGGTFTVQDSSGAPIFEVRDDGTVHILTGGTIHADL